MATHSSNLARIISWTEASGRLQSMRSERVGHDWGTEHVRLKYIKLDSCFWVTSDKSFNLSTSDLLLVK